MSFEEFRSQLHGKDEAASLQIAERVGAHLCDDDLSAADRRAAELLARALVEDAIETVRGALSGAIGHAKHLPRDLALKIAHDVDSVACPFLEVTEVFSESDWQQILLTISRGARMAVARRPSLSEDTAKTLAQVGDTLVAEALIENPAAPMSQPVCLTLMDRFSSENWVMDKLAQRDDLIAEIAVTLTTMVSAAAREKLVKAYDLPGATDPLAEKAESDSLFLAIQKTSKADLSAVAEEMHRLNKLSPAIILRALQENFIDFLEAALSVRAGRSLEHVRSVIHRAGSDAVRQLLGKAAIPENFHREFWRDLELIRQIRK